ncbi:MAG TPA: hypothetical protein VFN19_06160 [Candidatus Nanopelagicales bacterium]|nr:hypothetical protein [Candidatus Nanopelagicales bacterium]
MSTTPTTEPPVPTLQRDRSVLVAVIATTAVSLVGAAVSVAGDLSPTYLEALGPDGHLSVPLPMTAFQVVTALLAAAPHRRRALVGSGLLAVAVTVALVSGIFDGGYSDERLDAGQRAVQVVLVVGLVAVAGLAARRFVTVLRAGRSGSGRAPAAADAQQVPTDPP